MNPLLSHWFRYRSHVMPERTGVQRKKLKFMPSLEVLEDRTVPSTTIQGTFFHDLNQNGALDAGEPGLAGWSAFLDGNRSGIVDPGELAAVTDANGNYVLDSTGQPPEGVYEGDEYDYLGSVLESDSGGRWIPTSPSYIWVNRTDEPTALGRNFGFYFQADVGRAPVGGETLVNQTLAGTQGSRVDVAADADGNFVVAWVAEAGGTSNLMARCFDADGTAAGGEILVATSISHNYLSPVVARAANGTFALAWNSTNNTNGNSVVYTRVYSANGTPLTASAVQVTQINKTYRAHVQDIAMDADGDYAVLYRSAKSSLQGTYWSNGPYAIQRYSKTGAIVGKSVDVAESNTSENAALGMDNTGNFVVAWGNYSSIFAQRFTSAAKKTGSQLIVATESSVDIVTSPRVAMNGSGQFVVNWQRDGMGEARLYSATGTSLSDSVVVGIGFANPAVDEAGNATFVNGYGLGPQGYYPDGGYFNVGVRHLTASGNLEPMMLVNTTTQGWQGNAVVAATGNGSFVVAWDGNGTGDNAGVFFQRYTPIPAPLVAAALPQSPTSETLSAADLQAMFDAALSRWQAAGFDTSALSSLNLQIANLGGSILGLASGNTIWIDDDAAGWGWFVDPTPSDDSEFLLAGDQGEQGHMDLLSVLTHEIGHLLGFDHEDGGLMDDTLAAGTRTT
jgi:hypothetical protein